MKPVLKILLWKEWKEIWRIWLGLLLSALVIMRLLPGTIYLFMAFLAIYTGFIGARSFAREKETGTLDYQQTQPIHPLTILWSKYLAGFLQLIILFFIFEFYTGRGYFPHYGELPSHAKGFYQLWMIIIRYPLYLNLLIVLFLSYIALYSFCFLLSILIKDTLRSFFVGFSLFLLIKYFSNRWMFGNPIFLITVVLDLLALLIIILGSIGISYYSIYRKRFVWKTGFIIFIPLGIILLWFSYYIHYGNQKPVSIIQNMGFIPQSYWNGKVYGINERELIAVDVQNPQQPAEKSIMRLSRYVNQWSFDDNRFYTIEYDWQEKNKPSELVAYDLTHEPSPQLIQRLSLPPIQVDTTVEKQLGGPLILYSSDKDIYLAYTILTGYQYRDSIDQIKNIGAYDKVPPSFKDRQEWLYRRHYTKIDKKNFQFTGQGDFDWPLLRYLNSTCGIYAYRTLDRYSPSSVIGIYDNANPKNPVLVNKMIWMDTVKSPWDNSTIGGLEQSEVKGKYLYALTFRHPLEIYDLSDGKNPKLISQINWDDWMDKLIISELPIPFIRGYFDFNENRLFIDFVGRLNIYDISNPYKPHKISTLVSRNFGRTLIHDNYFYVSDTVKGFAIFHLPKVKS